MAVKNLTSAARVRELLIYDPETGIFKRRVGGAGFRITDAVGTVRHDGLRVLIDRQHYYLHRLAWLYMTGAWPAHFIDHIDGDNKNNAFRNLRDVAHKLNMQNQRRAHRDAASRLLGVCRSRNHWAAFIAHGGKNVYLGVFDTEEAAHAAYLEAKRRLHDGCTL